VQYRPLYIAATGQHIGKTTTAIGLVRCLQDMGLNAGFMKPVGQSYVVVNGDKVDEDAVLIRDTFHQQDRLKDMSPIAVERGFTEEHIFARDQARLRKIVGAAYLNLLPGKDAMIIEGTGHAGVGSCFGLSNADVAEALGCSALIVSGGGIGRPIDEIALSASLFGCRNVPTLGAVLNKVIPEKAEKIRRVVSTGLGNMGMRLLGVAPYIEQLTYPSLGQLVNHIRLEVLCGEEGLSARAEHNIVAAMEPEHMAGYLRDHTLVITPGDRADNIAVCISAHLADGPPRLAGLVLTGGLVPDGAMMEQLRRSGLPVLLSPEDTYSVSTHIRELVFKIESGDRDKIETAQRMIREHVDVGYLLENLRLGRRRARREAGVGQPPEGEAP
jgi:hypothetical protein